MRSSASVLGPERPNGSKAALIKHVKKQRGSSEKTKRSKGEQKRTVKEQGKAMKHKKKHRSSFWLPVIIAQSYVVFISVKTAA